MKRYFLTLAILGLAACGGGSGQSADVVDPNDFTGSFSLRDDNCVDAIIEAFSINTDDTLMTVKNGGGTELIEGDVFALTTGTVNGSIPTIEASALGCIGSLIQDQAMADETANNSSLNVQVGDLLVVCPDSSVDGNCAASYRRE